MKTKKTNWMFLVIVLFHVGLSFLVSFVPAVYEIMQNMAVNIVVSEITIWLPAVLFLAVGEPRSAATPT